MAQPMAELVLTDDETQTLTTWATRPKSTQRLALRAKIVLACARGLDNKAVADELRICSATVGTWRKRFVERRLDGLADEPRPCAPRKIDAPMSSGSSLERWKPGPKQPPTGEGAAWPRPRGSRSPRLGGSGGPSA